MMQTQISPTTATMEKQQQHQQQHQRDGSEVSMDEKKESSVAETTATSTGSHNTYNNVAETTASNNMASHHHHHHHQNNVYNPYAVAAAAQYHNMMVLHQQQQQQHQHRHSSSGSNDNNNDNDMVNVVNGMTLHHPHAHHAGHHHLHQHHPPQQVYVDSLMQHHPIGSNGGSSTQLGHLETQFQSLGFTDNEAGEKDDNNNNSNSNGSDANNGNDNSDNDSPHDNNDGEEGNLGEDQDDEGPAEDEEEPLKLFVGQVPKTMNEEDIFPTFDSFGPLKDVSIIRDKHTQLHRGCAFVTYWSAEDAEKAQEALHGKHTFPGARRPAQVKPAEPSVPENKLFVGMLSRKAGEDEVRELFAPFGEIREIYMIRNADGSSKCAAFLRYVQRESAFDAIESLHSNLVMDGAARPLIVKFADNKQQRHQRHIRNVRRQEMMATMGGPGAYPGYQVPPQMAMGPHGGGPAHYAPMGHPQYAYAGPAAAAAAQHPHVAHPQAYAMYAQYGHPHYGYQGRQEGTTPNRNSSNPRPREGPAGANLFVYHLPHDLTDADLATAFNAFGNVISAKVYVDRYTGESKGFGFVSYDSVISAESAIEQMNGFQIGNKRLKVQHKRVHGNHQQPHHGPPHHQHFAHHHYHDAHQFAINPEELGVLQQQVSSELPSGADDGAPSPPTTQSD